MPPNERATVESTLLSGVHGRQRRAERNIQKIDLQRARRYGMKETQDNGRIKYTYGGVVFIYCPRNNREVTSFPSPDKAAMCSGTRVVKPILLDKTIFPNEKEAVDRHELVKKVIPKEPHLWTSHSVLVVDMSGSMRRDDVSGARCRSDGVWMALARDYVQIPLQKDERSPTDLISIIVMRKEAEVVMKHEPTSYVLYNRLIDMRDWDTIRPRGPGNYLPALEKAEELLTLNTHAGCSLSLLFFSDGRPSDKGDFVGKIGELASKFGRRLSMACVGMAEDGENFATLNDMVTEAQSFGAQASFGQPKLSADSLSNIISSLSTSLTTSKTEMTARDDSRRTRLLRMVTREKLDTPDDVGTWKFYEDSSTTRYVRKMSTWSYQRGSAFVEVFDPRCVSCRKYVGTASNTRGMVCIHCKSHCVCLACNGVGIRNQMMRHRARTGGKDSDCEKRLSMYINGKIISKRLPSFAIAIKESTFGEGAERIVRKVRFLDENGRFIGPPMVAKESRFIEDHDDGASNRQERMDYHREFMRTQDIANECAKKFNEALDGLVDHFDKRHHRMLARLPRIHFIAPMVVEVIDSGKERDILVERFLEGEYKKFNNNMGYVDHEVTQAIDDLAGQTNNRGLGGGGHAGLDGLGAIEEGSEEDTDDEDDGEDIFDAKESAPVSGTYSDLQGAYFPQAFSHFSYEKSKKHFMVVDLQGVYTTKPDRTRCYELTDPVIHKHRKKRKKKFKTWSFGRTDRGEKGMKAFFETHKCTDVCKLLGLTEVR